MQSNINNTINFSLISKQLTLQEFTDVDIISRSYENDVYTIQINEEYDEECNVKDKHWIPMPNKLEERSYMLIE